MTGTRPILVTGAHRSGTGWVGSMIAASPDPPVAYLWEPFSILHRRGILDVQFPYWFPYVCAENETAYIEPIQDMLAFRYHTAAELHSVRWPKDVGRFIRDLRRFQRFRVVNARPLLKDPVAVMSAGWLATSFEMDVVVLIRHPAAFANSIRARGWRHPFSHFLAQPLLMRDLLGEFEDELRTFERTERPLLEQGILLWRLIYHVIAGYRERFPEWKFVRLEDLGRDPVGGFEEVYRHLGLRMTDGVRARVRAHSDASNPSVVQDPAAVHRDSAASITTWKTRFSDDEVKRIRDAVEPISSHFYGDEDW